MQRRERGACSRRGQCPARPGRVHTDRMESEPGSLVEYFDGWYADMTGSSVKDEIQQRHLGLPPYLLYCRRRAWSAAKRPSRLADPEVHRMAGGWMPGFQP